VIGELDRDLLAAETAAWADARSARSNDRFSYFDLRAGAAFRVAASGVVAERAALDELLEDVVERAVARFTVRLTDADYIPGHVKSYRATATVQIKADLETQLQNWSMAHLFRSKIRAIVPPSENDMGFGPLEAVQSIAGTSRLRYRPCRYW
jgi:hypothetical protein